MGSYRGGETPSTFGDPAGEFAALLNGAALFDLSWQAKLLIGGKDRTRWLNGMITNNVRDLVPGRGVYAFVLTPQGHNQGDLTAYNRGEYLLAITDREQLSKLQPLLQRYIIMDKVELEDISDKLASVGIAGPKAAETLSKVGIDTSQLEPGQVVDAVWQDVGISIARNAHPQMDSYEIWVAPENVEKLWDALVSGGAKPGRQRGARELSNYTRRAAIWPRPSRARFAAGNRPGTRAELQQGLLHRPGNCRTDSSAR